MPGGQAGGRREGARVPRPALSRGEDDRRVRGHSHRADLCLSHPEVCSAGVGAVPYLDVAKLAIMVEGQEGIDWRLWRHLAETVEGLGFDSFWRSDHLYSVMGAFDRATIECWASLALIATWTKRIPFGPNVSP